MMKNFLIIAGLFMILSGCNEPLEPGPVQKITIQASQHGSDFLFARLPIFFSPAADHPHNFPVVNGWIFGDGNSAQETQPYHTFDFPGAYKVSVIRGKDWAYEDTTLLINSPLALFGSKKTAENGKFLLKHPVSGYTVIHTLNGGSSVDDWRLLSTSASFDSIQSDKIPFEAYSAVTGAFVNNKNNLVLISEFIWEIDHAGNVLKKTFGGSAWTPKSGIQVADGYQMAGWHFQGKLRVSRFNNDLGKTAETDIDVSRQGFLVTNFYLESEDVLRLHYATNSVEQNPEWLLMRMRLSGEILMEKSYSSATDESFPLVSGYLLAGVQTDNYGSNATYVFAKINTTGDIEWTVTSPLEDLYPQYVHSGSIRVIEDNSFIYIFFDNQKGIKVSNTGQVIWSKRFGLSTDTFNDVLKNNSGKFVVLGSHQFDYRKFEYTTDYNSRDLVLIEIDENGNIVEPGN